MMVRPSTSTATIRNTESKGPENTNADHAIGAVSVWPQLRAAV